MAYRQARGEQLEIITETTLFGEKLARKTTVRSVGRDHALIILVTEEEPGTLACHLKTVIAGLCGDDVIAPVIEQGKW